MNNKNNKKNSNNIIVQFHIMPIYSRLLYADDLKN